MGTERTEEEELGVKKDAKRCESDEMRGKEEKRGGRSLRGNPTRRPFLLYGMRGGGGKVKTRRGKKGRRGETSER